MLLVQRGITAFQPTRMMHLTANSIFLQPRTPFQHTYTTTLAMSSDAPATVQRMV